MEQSFLNSSTTPDAYHEESFFRDHEIATRAIEGLKTLESKIAQGPKRSWMLSVGFKQPHTWYHMPKKYFDMYRDSEILAELDERDLVYPDNTPSIGYR